MNRGQVKELDSPYSLLQNPRSLFYKMVQKTGPSASKKLLQMARDAYNQRQTVTVPSNRSVLLWYTELCEEIEFDKFWCFW